MMKRGTKEARPHDGEGDWIWLCMHKGTLGDETALARLVRGRELSCSVYRRTGGREDDVALALIRMRIVYAISLDRRHSGGNEGKDGASVAAGDVNHHRRLPPSALHQAFGGHWQCRSKHV